MSLKISDLAALNTVTVGATGFTPKLLVEGSNSGGLAEIYVSAGSGNALRLNTNFANGNYIDINPYITGISNGGFEINQNGTQRFVITAGGNVGIGTTSDAGYKLNVNGGFYGSYFKGGDSGAGSVIANFVDVFGTSVMYVRGDNRVGIGTTTPQKPLEVISAANDFVSIGVNQIGVGVFTGIHFGYREANASYRKSAIVFERTDLSANDAQGKIHILNGPQGGAGSATLTDARLTIAENGNVGIGNRSPSQKFDVNGVGAFGKQDYSIQGVQRVLILRGEPVSGVYANNSYRVYTTPGALTSAQRLSITAEYNGTESVDLFSLTGTGNVLIGSTTDSGYKLQVTGGIITTTNSVIANTFTFINLENNSSKLQVSRFLAIQDNGSNVGIGYNQDSVPVGAKVAVNGNSYFNGTITTTNNVTFGSGVNRPVTYDTNGGNFRIKGNAGGWAMGYFFDGSSDTFRGGFGGYGGGNDLTYYWIGSDYNIPTMIVQPNQGNVGINTQTPVTRLGLNSYSGTRLAYIQNTAYSFDGGGITVGSSTTSTSNKAGGIDLTNNTYSPGAYSPIISFSSLSSNSVYNNSYAAIWGVLGGQAGDANWVQGDLVFGTANSYGIQERMRIAATGITTFTNTVTATGFFNSSDIRLKEIVDYDYSVSDIKPILYLWKDSRDNKKHVGYSAQEVQKVMPDAVSEDKDGMLSVNYIEVLVAKIAELENRIKQLEK